MCLKCESGSSRFQPGEGPSRGLLRDYEHSDGTFSSTTGHPHPNHAVGGHEDGGWPHRHQSTSRLVIYANASCHHSQPHVGLYCVMTHYHLTSPSPAQIGSITVKTSGPGPGTKQSKKRTVCGELWVINIWWALLRVAMCATTLQGWSGVVECNQPRYKCKK